MTEKETPYEVTPSVEKSPSTLISQALTAGADLEKLQGLLDLQLKWESNEARKAYMVAMAAFKCSPPQIIKDGTVDYQPQGRARVHYNHSTLANVATTINKALGEHGLSATWRTDQPEGKGIKVTCVITHELGHSEETSLTAGPDATGGKNAIQQVGSTVTYLQRYTILAMTGLATKEGDNDGGDQDDDSKKNQEPSFKEFNNKRSEVDGCTNKVKLDKWIAENKPWIDTLSDNYRELLKTHCQQYYDMFKKEAEEAAE